MVSDSDADARAALRDPQIRQTILEWWGPDILDEKGEINRSSVASIIFSDQQARRKLEAVAHPWIEKRRLERFSNAPADAPALVIDAPLLFEAGLDAACDGVIYVDASPELRLKRVMATRGWSAGELALREQSQLPLDLKRQRADYVVENNGDLTELRKQVRRVLDTIVQRSRCGGPES